MWTVQDCFFSQCVFSSLRWEAIPLHSVWGLLHPEGKPASPHQTSFRGEAFQMSHVQLRLPTTWRLERAPAHPFWYQPATHSHAKLILYAPVYSIMLVGFSLLHVGFSLLLNLNTCWACMALTVTPRHAPSHGYTISHMTSYSLTPGNVLTHFQFTCFTCRHAARPLICTSSVLFETT